MLEQRLDRVEALPEPVPGVIEQQRRRLPHHAFVDRAAAAPQPHRALPSPLSTGLPLPSQFSRFTRDGRVAVTDISSVC